MYKKDIASLALAFVIIAAFSIYLLTSISVFGKENKDFTNIRRIPIEIEHVGAIDIPFAIVCNDGTIWEFSRRRNRWNKLPDIPQN